MSDEIKITTGAVVEEPGSSINNKTGSWRSGKKPVRDIPKCIKCMRCWLVCPDNAINEKIETNYDFCKGCGVCAKECPVKCIEMVDEDKICTVIPKEDKTLEFTGKIEKTNKIFTLMMRLYPANF